VIVVRYDDIFYAASDLAYAASPLPRVTVARPERVTFPVINGSRHRRGRGIRLHLLDGLLFVVDLRCARIA